MNKIETTYKFVGGFADAIELFDGLKLHKKLKKLENEKSFVIFF